MADVAAEDLLWSVGYTSSQSFCLQGADRKAMMGCPAASLRTSKTGVQGQPDPHTASYLREMGKVKKIDESLGSVYCGINKGLGLWGPQDPLVLSRSLKSQT